MRIIQRTTDGGSEDSPVFVSLDMGPSWEPRKFGLGCGRATIEEYGLIYLNSDEIARVIEVLQKHLDEYGGEA